MTITLYLSKADQDADGTIAKKELARVFPEAKDKFPESFPMKDAIHHVRLFDHDLMHELTEAIVKKQTVGSAIVESIVEWNGSVQRICIAIIAEAISNPVL